MIKPYKLPSVNYCAGPIPQLHNQDHVTWEIQHIQMLTHVTQIKILD